MMALITSNSTKAEHWQELARIPEALVLGVVERSTAKLKSAKTRCKSETCSAPGGSVRCY